MVFGYLVSLSTILGLLKLVGMLVAYLLFHRGMKVQGISRENLPFSGHFQKARAQIALFFTVGNNIY